jgi:hypothetical protein
VLSEVSGGDDPEGSSVDAAHSATLEPLSAATLLGDRDPRPALPDPCSSLS